MPDSVVVVSTREELLEGPLFDEEESAVARAVEKRRREFVTGRTCARRALERLGVEPGPIPHGERGEPRWPPGVVGSITHCRGYRASAAARAADVLSVGIDAEVHEPLPDGVLESVAFGSELAAVARGDGGICLDRVLFSAKESIYKAWFPLARRWLGFEDVTLEIDPGSSTFRAQLLVPGPQVGGAPITEFRGRFAVEDGIVATASLVMP